MLKTLVRHPRMPLSREKLMALARGREYGAYDRSLDVQVSRLRKLIEAGEVAKAGRLLLRPYSLQGDVVPGRGIGSTQTVPTLNLRTSAEVLPATGVYACRALVGGGAHMAAVHVGERPTFARGRSVEAHLLDWAGDLYGRRLTVEFVARLRGEQRFPGQIEVGLCGCRDHDALDCGVGQHIGVGEARPGQGVLLLEL